MLGTLGSCFATRLLIFSSCDLTEVSLRYNAQCSAVILPNKECAVETRQLLALFLQACSCIVAVGHTASIVYTVTLNPIRHTRTWPV